MKLKDEFYLQRADTAAPALVGKVLVMRRQEGTLLRMRITETECYLGTKDTACHASRGKTPRTSALWLEGGHSYVYLCYGMYHMFNVITGKEDDPQGVLIRGVEGYMGPGKFTKFCGLDMSFNRLDLRESDRLWIEDDGFEPELVSSPRIGIGYADKRDQERLWRFTDKRFFKK
jgi:DNA-3-methyladenine glycosylase